MLTKRSVSGAIWNNVLPEKLQSYLPEGNKAQAMAIYKSIVVAQKFQAGTPARAAINKAYREAQQLLAITATAALAPMLLIMFALKTIDLTEVNDSRAEDNKSIDNGETDATDHALKAGN